MDIDTSIIPFQCLSGAGLAPVYRWAVCICQRQQNQLYGSIRRVHCKLPDRTMVGELICGVLMIIGVRTRSAALAIAAMLAVFTAAITISLLRGTPIGCGCFSSVEEQVQWTTVMRDLLWLAMTIHVYVFDEVLQLERKFMIAVRDI